MAIRRTSTFWGGYQLRADADIPDYGDMSIGTSYVDCTNISTTKVRNIIGESVNQVYHTSQNAATFTIGGAAGYVNAWARYKPGYVDYVTPLPTNCYDNPTFEYHQPDHGDMGGGWAGYNHTEDTRPVYWPSGKGNDDMGMVMAGMAIEVKGGLSRGKMAPVLGGPEEEYYWGRVKIQVYRKVNSGSYSLYSTSGFVDLSELSGEDATLIYTMGGSGESVGNTYTVCERPVYLDSNDDIVAVIEDGVRIFHYHFVTPVEYAGLYAEDNGTTCTKPGQYNRIDYDFYLYNQGNTSITLDVRLKFYGAWVNQANILGYDVVVPANSSYHFTGYYFLSGTIPDPGTMDGFCEVQFNGGGWYSTALFIDDLAHYAQ